MQGASTSKSLSKEFRRFSRAVEAGQVPNVRDVTLVGDALDVWRFSFYGFDEDTCAGKRLNEQLLQLHAMYDHPPCIIMEARFPPDYPNLPFLLRVVSPRMAPYTGHVTAGGSICIEALTTSGGPGAWQPSFTVESITQTVVQNMLHAEEMYVRTAMGGGQAGPLQVDMSRGRWAVQEYSLAEANAAFQRTLANHGWGGRPGGGGGRQGAAAGPSAAPAAAGASSSASAAVRAAWPSAAAAAAGVPAPFSSSSAVMPGPGLLAAGGLSGPGSLGATAAGQVLSHSGPMIHRLQKLLNGPPNFTPTHSWTGPSPYTPNHLHAPSSHPLLGNLNSQLPPPPLSNPQRPPPPSVLVPTPVPAQPQATSTASNPNRNREQPQPQPQAGAAASVAAMRNLSGSGAGGTLASSSTPFALAGRDHDGSRRRTVRALRGLRWQQQPQQQPQGQQQQQQQQLQQTPQQHVVDLTLDDDVDGGDGGGRGKGSDDVDMDTFMPAPAPTAPVPAPAVDLVSDAGFHAAFAISSDDDECEVGVGRKRNRPQPHRQQQQEQQSTIAPRAASHKHSRPSTPAQNSPPKPLPTSAQQHTSSSAHHSPPQPPLAAHGANGTGSSSSSSRAVGRAAAPTSGDSVAPIEIDLTDDSPRIVRRRTGEASSKQQQQQQQHGHQVDRSDTRPAQQSHPPPAGNAKQQRTSAGGPQQRAPRARSTHFQVFDDTDDCDVRVVGVRQAPPPPPPPVSPLEESLALANLETGLNLCMPPPHWHPTDTMLRGNVTFVELPLPGAVPQSSQVAAGLAELQSNGLNVLEARAALAAAGNDSRRALQRLVEERVLEPEAVTTLVANGVSQQDAEAALMLKKGDVNEALMLCIECNETGSQPSDLLRQKRRKDDAAAEASKTAATENAEAEEHRRKHLLLEQEAEMVLKRFEASGGLRRAKVRKVERVQNLQLYTDYDRSLRKIQHQTKGNPNVKSLFHGADVDTVKIIVNEGLDHRVSNLSGALGAGAYFAQSSSYSDTYSRAPKHSWDVISTRSGAMAMPPPIIAPSGMPPAMLKSSGSSMSGVASSSSLHTPWGIGGSVASGLPRIASHKLSRKLIHGSHSHGRHQQQQQPLADPSSPAFMEGCVAMLLCDVVMGVVGNGGPHMRRPPPNCHSTSCGNIFAVYDDTQAYPTHVIHYEP